MANLPIRTYPDPILKKKTAEVEDPQSPEIRELVLDMIETMEKNDGLGLAAPQVGKSLRVCVLKLDGKTYALVNPRIKSKSFGKELCDEGCLSFPGKFLPVKRHKKITVKALDRKGSPIEIEAEGLFSRALQHEIDHLDGKLFVERAEKNVSPEKNEE